MPLNVAVTAPEPKGLLLLQIGSPRGLAPAAMMRENTLTTLQAAIFRE
jgi:hypothetical protein